MARRLDGHGKLTTSQQLRQSGRLPKGCLPFQDNRDAVPIQGVGYRWGLIKEFVGTETNTATY